MDFLIIVIIILSIINCILAAAVLYFSEIKEFFSKRKLHKEVNPITTLTEIKLKDDVYLERDKNLVQIDTYIEYVSSVIDKFNNSRNKRVALATKKQLLESTIKIIPIFTKFIDVTGESNLDVDLSKCDLRELMGLLESTYNDFTHDNLDCINNIIAIVIKIRDTND